MNLERHYERLKESLEVIDESLSKTIVKRQRTIGFNCSAAAVDMLEILLHKKDLIDPGFVIKHDWFKSKNKIKDKFPFDFKNKRKIFDIMQKIEEKRNALCYGVPKKETVIKEVILDFNKLKKIFKTSGVEIEE